ncbi:MAG: hypothetical protein JW870_11870 [Candidatus Delongbacteria bacterium]|nr:hypothetical protein [Candidatus Delongbacteria bacterium]
MGDNIRLLSGNYYFKDFVLTIESLKILLEILSKFSQKLSTKFVFYIETEDKKFIETTEITDIVNNPNSANKKILTLGIEVCKLDSADSTYKKIKDWRDWIVRIVFFKKGDPKVKFSITAIDPEWSKLLTNEIQPQIERTLKTKCISLWHILFFFFLIFALFQSLFLKFSFYDIFPKLIVPLIKYFPFILFFIGTIYISNASRKKFSWFTNFFGPESIFLWGDEVNVLTHKEQLRKTILISTVLAFIINVIANLYFFTLISN